MKGDQIPKTDTVSRYCSASRISESGRPLMTAFQLSNSDLARNNPHLSVNWLEYFSNRSKEVQIDEIKRIFARKMNVRATAKFALINVSKIHENVAEVRQAVRVLHWPDIENKDDSHAGIFDVEADPDVIAQALSRINCEMVAAK